ncbi:MAG TPA: cell division protein ZapE [Candidatus Azoamicus sp. OHIO1]
MSKLIDKYNFDVLSSKIIYDSEQAVIVEKLDVLFDRIILEGSLKSDIFSLNVFNFLRKKDYLGMYIWGDVGIGKTYLVDLFYHLLPIKNKLRLHFHHFMKLIHEKLKEFSGVKDPLKMVAKMFYKKYVVICLDEFFVKDIGDAMILAKLFNYLFIEYKIIFLLTSNVIPNKLYLNGLQRQKFLPAIFLMEENLEVIGMLGNRDYRLRNLDSESVYIFPLVFSSFKLVRKLFFKLCTIPSLRNVNVEILGRKILSVYVSGSVVWFDFNIICGHGRCHLDYIELASVFNTVFISCINFLSHNDDDKVRRFISLVDEFYDRKIKLIITAASNVDFLYLGGGLNFDFKRTISRIKEMGTKEYLKDSDRYVI